MGNVLVDLADGAAKGLFSGLGQLFKDARTAITGIDPEKRADLELKLTELEGQAEQLRVASDKIAADDRDSARKREVEARKAGSKETYPMILDILAIVAFVGCLYALFTKALPDGTGHDILVMLIGCLTVIVKDIYGYWRGSSAGSSEKSSAISDALRSLSK